MSASPRYAFGDFVLEPSQQRVRGRDGHALNLTPRLFAALQLFVENAGQLLDKDALMLALWPGLVVDENSLSQVVSGLRRALADDAADSRYIQTVPRRGFRFIAAVTVLPDQPVPETSGTLPLDAPGGRTAERRHWLRLALAGGAAAGLGGLALWVWRGAPATGPAPPHTLAVLPFKPLTAEGRDDLLEVGMADSLIARLSTVPGLVVRSVGSVGRYAGADQDPLRAAHELDVAWIVDGSLQRRGDQLRVTARLLRAADGGAVWSGSFDEKFTGVFEVQDTISERVARVLTPSLETLAVARQPPVDVGATRNTDAYQLYLAAGRYAQDMRADGLRKSIALYNQALEIDPGYALAWTGLAETHRRSLFGADVRPAEVFEPAAIAVQHALALAPNLAEALTERAFKLYWFDFDWAGAEREFRRVLAIKPNVAAAHFGLASLLLNRGQADEGFAQMRMARELDPMSTVLNTLEAAYLFAAGRLDEARTRLNRALDIAPRFWLAHSTQGLLHLADRQPDKAIAELRDAVTLADGISRPSALLAVSLAGLGQTHEARAILSQLITRAKSRYVPPSSLAAVYAALGEVGPALDALDQAVVTHDTRLSFLKDDVRLASLRSEPRFAALLRKLNLDRYGPGFAPL
ncbi:MAG TPA: winged helix-turn-helix domain-containing protein [Burkholderiaceae bacterium]|nr:winged helix-turn-helix domain-containing protein [Burkholderiaceae bacterium]